MQTPQTHVSRKGTSQKPCTGSHALQHSPHLPVPDENTALLGSLPLWERVGPLQQLHEVDTIFIPVLQTGKLRLGEARLAV